jgi:translation initiation factor 1
VKKNKVPPRISTETADALTHSPFAKLSARADAPAPATPSAAPEPKLAPQARGRLVLRRETKHRGGKAVIIVSGFDALQGFDARAIEALATECKRTLGCGGTVDSGEIVLQGDRPAEVAELLREKGFRVAGVTA